MKIEHELSVQVVRYQTIIEALIVGLGRQVLEGPLKRILNVLHLDKMTNEEYELSLILHELLWNEYEGERTYTRTLAVASLNREVSISELYHELIERGYYPASISEGMSYLSVLGTIGGEIDTVLHLGTFLCTSTCGERRLLTRKNGTIELYPITVLKSYFRIIVVKKEKVRK